MYCIDKREVNAVKRIGNTMNPIHSLRYVVYSIRHLPVNVYNACFYLFNAN